MTVFRPSQYMRCLLLARVDARQDVPRAPKGIPVMAHRDGPSYPGGNSMLGDGARALRLERDRTPRALPDVFCLREGPPASQVDPALP